MPLITTPWRPFTAANAIRRRWSAFCTRGNRATPTCVELAKQRGVFGVCVMNRILLATTALTALAMAAPAAAQYSSQTQAQPQAEGRITFESRIERLETRIESGMRQGSITRDEAAPLLRELSR